MGEENQPNQNDNSNEQATKFNISTEGSIENKGKKKRGLFVIALVLIVAIIAGLIYYFTSYTKPDQIYKRLVGSSIDSYTTERKNMNYETSKTSFKIDADLDTDKIDKNVADLINKINLGMDVQTSKEDKKFIMNLKADYEQENLLDVQMYSEIDKEKTYMQFKNFLNKYMEVEDIDDEFYTYFEEILEKEKMSTKEKQALQKAKNILKKEITNAIKEEYCTAQKEDIKINGKTIATTKNTIKMTSKQVKKELTTVFTNLKDNKEFMDYFEKKEEVTETLESFLDQLEELEGNDKSTIEIGIYTNGFTQNIQKATLTVYSEENEETVTMAVTKTEKNCYEFEILQEKNTLGKGTVKVEEKNKEEGTIHFELEVEDFGKLKLNIEYSQKLNQEIDEVDVKDAVKSDKLTSSDQQELMTNLQKSKLYELMESFSGGKGVSNSNLTGTNTQKQSTPDLLEEEDDNDIDDDSDEEEAVSTKENEIVSYDGKEKITFKMPEGYQLAYTSDNYKAFEKDDKVSIKISTAYADNDKYYKDLQEKKKYFEEDPYYKNVTLSDMSTMEVKGKTFYRATLSYEYTEEESGKKETTFIWTKISDKSVVDFEIQNSNTISSQELEEILTIDIQKK